MHPQRKWVNHHRSAILRSIELLLITILIVLVFIIIQRIVAQYRIRNEEQASSEALQTAIAAPSAEQMRPGDAQAIPEIRPEIAELMKENPDAVGLLHFEGSRTLYVCQTTDNSYYKSHRFDGSEDPAGMVFMDCRDSLWPRSDNLILYGHNMRDGSRFGTLRRFEQKAYLMEHPIFQLAGLYENIDYVPFAIFHTTVLPDAPDYFAFDQTDFANDKDFRSYITEVKSRSTLKIPIEVSPGDRLLTLATCYSNLERGRLVIVCREVKNGETFAMASRKTS